MPKRTFPAAAEGMPEKTFKDSILGNQSDKGEGRKTRMSGKASPDAPSVSASRDGDDDRAIPPSISKEKIMNQHVRALSALSASAANAEAKAGDCLLDAIRSFEAGRAFANRIQGLEDDERDALMDSVYNPQFECLVDWAEPASSRESAIAALRLAVDENDEFLSSALAKTMVKAAFKFFASEVDSEDQADRRWEVAEAASANETRKAEVPTSKSYDLNDLDSDTAHLYELLEAVVDSVMDMPFERDGKRDTQLDRVNALLWIARDLAEQLSKRITDNFREIGSTCAGYSREKAA